jgi:glucose/arabinose dehydrogenase
MFWKSYGRSLRIFSVTAILVLALARIADLGKAANTAQLDTPTVQIDLVVGGLTRPVLVTHAGDGSGRLFIVEQTGRIFIYENGLLNTPFLDIHGRVRAPDNNGGGSEEGLLGLAFPPDYGNGADHFYVYYTNLDGNNRVSRFSLTADPDLADSTSEELILLFPHPGQTNHNGGQLAFGPDGYLYIGPGDGGGGNDPDNNAQDPASLLGKLLRIDVEFKPATLPGLTHQLYIPIAVGQDAGPAYRVPADNPFVSLTGHRPEIWALGLRNPWRFAFDRDTGDLFIGDVGQGAQEEIDFQPAASNGGENYGWDIWEGTHCIPGGCSTVGFTAPIHTYDHSIPPCASVTGGVIGRGAASLPLHGIYLFSDYCNGNIDGLQQNGNTWQLHDFPNNLTSISSFGEDEAGVIYLTRLSPGGLYLVTSP